MKRARTPTFNWWLGREFDSLRAGQVWGGVNGSVPVPTTLVAGDGIDIAVNVGEMVVSATGGGGVGPPGPAGPAGPVGPTGPVGPVSIVPCSLGGTGLAGYVAGDVLVAGDTGSISPLAAVAPGNVLVSKGEGVSPQWEKIQLGGETVSGQLATINGGTNSNAVLVNNRIMVSQDASIKEGPVLTDGQMLIGRTGMMPLAGTVVGGDGIRVTYSEGNIVISLA